ncbi:MAG: hypothetical protein CME70_21460 [Halobacteriovorax sp.]|nr:hypothetical protein [Halobacteriovorax sp.]|tara:strand:- start:151152 stop:153488 length:2337 start_codon:yes stop_codon:yes gene_type:complete
MVNKFISSKNFYFYISLGIAFLLISPYVFQGLPIYTEGHYHRHSWALGQLSAFDDKSSFFWRPRFLFGEPRFSNPLTINYYPITYLRYFVGEPFFSQILWFSSITLGFLGAFKLFKLFADGAVAFTAGIIFSLSGIMMISAFKGQMIEQLPFTVWVFYLYIKGFKVEDPKILIIAAIVNTFHLFATETQFIWFYGTTFLPIMSIYICWEKDKSFKKRALLFIKGNLIFFIPLILMTAILVIPVMELQRLYIPPLYDDMSVYMHTGRFNPIELRYSPFFLPGIFDHSLGIGRLRFYINLSYLGIIPIVTCVYCFIYSSKLKKIGFLLFTYFIFTAAMSYGIGDYIMRLNPALTNMRYSSHWLLVWNFVLCLMFCVGAKQINEKLDLKKLLISMGIVAFLLFSGLSYWLFRQENLDNFVLPFSEVQFFELIRPFLFLGLFSGSYFLAYNRKITKKTAFLAALIFCILDIFSWVIKVPVLYSNSLSEDPVYVKYLKEKYTHEKYVLPMTPKLGDSRSIRFDVSKNSFFDFVNSDFEMTRAGTTLTLERSIRVAKKIGWHESGFHRNSFEKDFLIDEEKRILANLFNIKYFFSKDDISEETLRKHNFIKKEFLKDYKLFIYENLDFKERVILYSKVRRVSKEEALEKILAPTEEIYSNALIENLPKDSVLDFNSTGSISEMNYKPDAVSLKVKTNGRMLLYLSDAHYPGWKAFINGREVKIYNTNYMGRGILVPSGESQVEFKFSSSSFKLGLILTVLGFLMSILTLFFAKKRCLRAALRLN